MTLLRFNQLCPPFDNVKMRQAVLAVTDQAEFMSALAGDPKNWKLMRLVLHLRHADGQRRRLARR